MSTNPYAPPGPSAQVDPRTQAKRELDPMAVQVLMLGSVIFTGGLIYAGVLPLTAYWAWQGEPNFAGFLVLTTLIVGLRLAAGILLWRFDPRGRPLQLGAVAATLALTLWAEQLKVTVVFLFVGLFVAALLRRPEVRAVFEPDERTWSLRGAGREFWLLHVLLGLLIAVAYLGCYLQLRGLVGG